MRLRIILAFHIALIYYTQDFRVDEGTRDQPYQGLFPRHPFFKGKALGTRLRETEERKEGSTSEIVKLIYEYKPLIPEEHTIAKTTNRRDI